jgi:dTDP-4-dehydrorhamnose reductase
MKLLVFGKTGQVARELQRRLPPGMEATFLGRDSADLTQPAACAEAILHARPDAVINAAAYTAVDQAESDEATATLVNGAAPGAMARACAELAIPFVHISTDYVFDGTGDTPFPTNGAIAPLGAYGRSKAVGEAEVRNSGAIHAILRTSWVFSALGNNFVKTMLRLTETRDRLTIVSDQVGGPTPASAIADACLIMAAQLREDDAKSGTYHFSGNPDLSWADFARQIFALSDRAIFVEDIPTSAFPTPAKRPQNSRLECSATQSTFGISRPQWKPALTQMLTELESVRS